jgi:hypothetical protein
MSHIEGNDLIFYKNSEGDIQSGGFSVKSFMMKQGISPILTLNNNKTQIGGSDNVSDLFDNLVIPNWLAYYPTKIIGGSQNDKNNINTDNDSDRDSDSDDEIIGGDLHDKLFDLVSFKDSQKAGKKTTRKNKNKNKNKNKGSKKK